MILRRVPLVGLVWGVAGVAGCTSMRRVQPDALVAENGPEVVWVTDTNNTVVAVDLPVIRSDTLREGRPGGGTACGSR